MKAKLFFTIFLATFAALLISSAQTPPSTPSTGARPNIIIILADDMGYSDLGCYGSEIHTPNIDALAASGVKMSQCYNTARCCPSRAELMTGLFPPQAGIADMTNEQSPGANKDDPPAYTGELSKNTVTIAEALHGAGYATLMTGKWHLGQFDQSLWPLQRGFERYYGSLYGAIKYFYPTAPRIITQDNTPVPVPQSTTDRQFYTTDAFTEHAIDSLKDEAAGKKRPFFLYLAYNAPHWPLQAFDDDLAKYRGKYMSGWDVLRQARYQRQIANGLIDPKWHLSPRTPSLPAWDSLSPQKKDEMDLRMSIYAAQVDRLDQDIGRLVSYLRDSNQLDNTLILFMSDNGACAEGGALGAGPVMDPTARNHAYFLPYSAAWANLSNTPLRLYKHFAQQGGSCTPLIAHWPAGLGTQPGWVREPAQFLDIMPTLLDITGATYPSSRDGNAVTPLEGVSFLPALRGKPLKRDKPLFMEHEGNAFIRDGDWKLVGIQVAGQDGVNPAKWELYNMQSDGTELNDLAQAQPDLVAKMSAEWMAWANRVGVYPKPTMTDRLKKTESDSENY